MKVVSNPLVSIIVPIYGVEEYLSECVNSILAQAYTKLEIILVDDGSLDNSPKMCDDFALIDNRIKVIHKTNGGLSDARNAGLKIAKGKFVSFIDSDDFISNIYIEKLLTEALKLDADIVEGNYYVFSDGKNSLNPKPYVKKRLTISSGAKTLKNLLTTSGNTETVSWNKLYKRELFTKNNIEYPKGLLHEDTFTTYKLYFYSKKTIFINEPIYYYRQRHDSIMGRKFDERRLVLLDAPNEIQAFAIKNKINIKNELLIYTQNLRLVIINAMVDSNSVDKKIFGDIRKAILITDRSNKSKYLSTRKHRLAMRALSSGLYGYTLVRKSFLIAQKRKR